MHASYKHSSTARHKAVAWGHALSFAGTAHGEIHAIYNSVVIPWMIGAFCADGMATVGDEDSCILLPEWAVRCGPRKTIYHDPKSVGVTGQCFGLVFMIFG